MTKEQLIQELVKARIAEARLKKGSEVKGDGTVVLYDNKNTK
jgi:transposase